MKPENVKCPECNGPMQPKSGKFGKFWGCIMFPVCKGTRDSMGLSKDDKRVDEDFIHADDDGPFDGHNRK